MKLIFVIVTLLSSLAAADDCIMQSRIRGFSAASETELTVNAGRADYIVNTFYCRELPWANRIGFKSWSSARVCVGDSVLVFDNFSNRVVQECRINRIERAK